VLDPLLSAGQLEESGFTHTELYEEFRAFPIGLVDVGARWGVSAVFAPAAPIFSVLAFEPDPDEAAKLLEATRSETTWAGLVLERHALADKARKVQLHLLARANNSSIYPVRQHYYDRYKLKGFEQVKTIELEAVPLDEIAFATNNAKRRFGEIIKIDTQGAELDILRGAERILRERTQCVVCEAAFFTPYEGACLFSDVERFLRDRSLSFYGFLDFQHRSTRRLDKRVHRGRERVMQADAVFFRDPMDQPQLDHPLSRRQVAVLLVSSLLFAFYDFAAELADLPIWSANERQMLSKSIKSLATVTPSQASEPIEFLKNIPASDTSSRLVEMGRWVDRLRDFQTYHDVPDER